MPTNYLPTLKPGTDDRLTTAQLRGIWNDAQDQARLGILADAIADASRNLDVRSIPDPWARAILFSRALYQSDHRLHLRMLGEWRGLLALIGLKEIRGFTELSATPLSLLDHSTGGGFLATLARIRPPATGTFAEGATWDEFHLLRWSSTAPGRTPRVFGLTAPTTLVMTGAAYDDVFALDEVPWFIDGLLTDPVATEGALSAREKLWLGEWIRAVRLKVRDLPPGKRLGDLLKLLETYADDLSKEATRPEHVFSDYGLGLTQPDIYRSIDKPRRRLAPTLTEVRIVTDAAASASKVFLLYDATLATQLGRREREICFYETETLASAPRRYEVLGTIKSGTLLNNATGEVAWCNPGFFFQDDLVYDQVEAQPGDMSGGADTFPGCRPVRSSGPSENRHILLPLTEDAARLFTPDYLERNFSIEWLHGGGARCRLMLEVTALINSSPGAALELAIGPNQQRHAVTLERVYTDKDLNRINGELIPFISIWPNFECQDEPANEKLQPLTRGFRNRWKRYYLFEIWPGAREAKELEVAPLDLPAAQRRDVRQQNGILQVVTPMQRYPGVLVCKMPFTGKKPRRNDNDPPRGLMILRRPEQVPIRHGTDALLGIDFGTTGTSIYSALLSGGELGDPFEMTFPPRLVPITARGQNEVRDLTRQHFIPAAGNPSGRILSVFQAKGTDGGTAELLDGHVLFPSSDAAAGVASPFVWGEPASIVIDLKWGTDPRQNAAAEAFLKQLCLQSLAELVDKAVESVQFRYSYPTAFSDQDREKFEAIWKETIRQLSEATSLTLTVAPDNNSNYEAVAATRYFKATGDLSIHAGAITLDIGGGTTDIAFWSSVDEEPSLADHSSVLFAGTNMFQAALRRRLGVLKEIDKDFPLPDPRILDPDKYRLAYNAELDALIASHAKSVLARLPAALDTSPAVARFLHVLELGLCGIAFYVGLLLGNLITKKRFPLDELRTIHIFVGGNASQLLHWCDYGSCRKGTFFYNAFCDTVRAGVELGAPGALGDREIQLKISDDPKHEVAYGLVAKATRPARSSDYAQPAGEEFQLGPDAHTWLETPDLAALAGRSLRVKRSLPVFRHFLASVSEELTPDETDTLLNSVNETLAKMMESLPANLPTARAITMRDRVAAKKASPIRNQPLFILLLKQLIDLRISALGKP